MGWGGRKYPIVRKAGRPAKADTRSTFSLGNDDGLTLLTMDGNVTVVWDEDDVVGILVMETEDAAVEDRMVDDNVVDALVLGLVREGTSGFGVLGVDSKAVAVR